MTRFTRSRCLSLSILALFVLSFLSLSITAQHVHKPHDPSDHPHQPKRDQSITQPINDQSVNEHSQEHSIKHAEHSNQIEDQSVKKSIDDQFLIHTEIPATIDMAALREAVMDARESMHEHTLDGLSNDLLNDRKDHNNQSTEDELINQSIVDLLNQSLADADDQFDYESFNQSINLFQEALEMLDHEADQSIIQAGIDRLIESSRLGNEEADFELGKIYLFGDLVDRNMTLSEKYFLRSADTGHPSSQHMIAFLYALHLVDGSSELDTAKSILYDYFAATGGDLGAKLSLGYRFMHGEGVPMSCTSALSYYRSAAEEVVNALPSPPHQSLLTIDRAHLLEESPRMEDSAEVVQYYQHSADSGNLEAAVALGQLHYYGQRGLPQSPRLAAKYFAQAAAAGDATAMTQLGQMHLAGLIDDQSISQSNSNSTAFDLFTRAAHMGNSQAQVNLGLIYLTGSIDGIEQDYSEAAKWFELASGKGNPEAQFQLGVMMFGGVGLKQDLAKAFQLFQVSAMNGHTKALFNVAQMQSSGLGTPSSCVEACMKMKLVAERGSQSHLLGEAHTSYWEAEWEASFLLYALAAHEGMETGQANAAYLIDRGYVDLWSKPVKPLTISQSINQSTDQSINQSTDQTISSSQTDDNQPTDQTIHPVVRNKHAIAYDLYRLSADQMNTDSMRMMGDYAFYGLIDPNHQSISHSENKSNNQSNSQRSYVLAANHYTRAGEHGSAQSFFNLGYLYHAGLGVQRDLHLAKRYYDQSITSDPSAYVPATLALGKLHMDVWMESISQWWKGSSDQSINQPINQSIDESFDQHTHTHSDHHKQSLQEKSSWLNWLMNWSCWQWNLYDWYESVEDAVLAISCCALAMCIYYRAQRM